MAFIKKITMGRNTYYSLVKSVRVGKKIKHIVLEYYGTQNPKNIKTKVEQMPFAKIRIGGVYSAGPLLCLFKLIKEYKIDSYIDVGIKKRQGIPAGLTLFIVALHKLFGFDPSLNNLRDWLCDTPLRLNPHVDISQFSSDNISYIFDKLFHKFGAVEELENIQARLFNVAKEKFGINDKYFYYDITSTYFEGNLCDDAEYGYSRDHRKDKKQITIGLLATKDRKFPVFTKVFKGNVQDKSTVIEIVTTMKHIYKFEDIIAIMDRGMTSETNLLILDVNEYGYILGASATEKAVKELILHTSKKKIIKQGKVYYTKKGVKIHTLSLTRNLHNKRRRGIIMYNDSLAQDQIESMRRKIEIAEILYKTYRRSLGKMKIREIEHVGKPFVNIAKKRNKWVLYLNKDTISETKKKAGKSVLITNQEDASDKIVEEYFTKDIVEKIFKFSKKYSNLRPIRRRLSQRVKIDVCLSFLSYYNIAFIRELLIEKGVKVTNEQLIAELPKIRLVVKQETKGKRKSYELVSNTPFQKKIIQTLNLENSIGYIEKFILHSDSSSET